MSIYDPALFVATSPFMHCRSSFDLGAAKVAIVGIPFDCGVHPTRVGARLGPAAIREQSVLVRAYEPPGQDFDPIVELNCVDCGSMRVRPSIIAESYAAIEEGIGRIVSGGTIPVGLGGDGAITLPQLRAVNRAYPDLVVLHIDAHTDTFPGEGSERDRFNTATTFTRAAEERVVDPESSFHIGARGPTYLRDAWSLARTLGYRVIPDHEYRSRGMSDVVNEIREKLTGRPVYLCFDMDYFDPSCAPGVATPAWGGATAYEGLVLLRALSGLRFVAFDINTVSPPHDIGGMTAFLAASCVREFLFLAKATVNAHETNLGRSVELG